MQKSHLTATSRNLTQNTLFHSTNRRQQGASASDGRHVSFREEEKLQPSASALATQAGEALHSNAELLHECKVHVPAPEDRWFTRSVHLERQNFPIHRASKLPLRWNRFPEEVDNIHQWRVTQRYIHEMNQTRHSLAADKPVDIATPADLDDYVRSNFPITLGQTYQVHSQVISTAPPPLTPTVSPPAQGVPVATKEPWRSELPWHSTHSSAAAAASQTTLNNSNFFTSSSPNSKSFEEKPSTTKASSAKIQDSLASIHVTSPYEMELARLRMNRLRLEEEMLMEVKRQDELERTRGPTPKWYELKTPQFHYEAHKNNSLLHCPETWDELMEYRQELLSKSQEFRTTFEAYQPYRSAVYASAEQRE